MTKSDLVEHLSLRFEQLTHKDVEQSVNAILDSLSNTLIQGQRIEIRGFGSFSVTHRRPRIGRNPRSGETVKVPEKKVPHFKAGKLLRESLLKSSV
jgi:integration host factor subunit beta